MTANWTGLDLRHLTALKAIADEGSFKGAARLLGYTPSAISQQIASLERIVGVQVIVREHGRKALGLTEAGRILLRHLTGIEARLGAARADIEALVRGATGPLRVGAFESVEARMLPDLLGRFRDVFPDVDIEVGVALLDLELLRSVERGSFDLAFAILPLPPGPFTVRAVYEDPWVLVAQAGSEHAALAAAPLSLPRIGDLPLVCFRSPRAIDSVLDRFRSAGVELNIVLRADYNEALQEFAATGLGVALMPRLAVNPHDERTAIIELGTLIPARQIALAWHCDRTMSDALVSFVSLAGQTGSQLARATGSGFDWRRSATA
jgi:LysR family transcriptional regulator, hydrogen peroxide-inducible genes activator